MEASEIQVLFTVPNCCLVRRGLTAEGSEGALRVTLELPCQPVDHSWDPAREAQISALGVGRSLVYLLQLLPLYLLDFSLTLTSQFPSPLMPFNNPLY